MILSLIGIASLGLTYAILESLGISQDSIVFEYIGSFIFGGWVIGLLIYWYIKGYLILGKIIKK